MGAGSPAGGGKSILWRGLALPGHEACRLSSRGSGWRLAGTAVFTHERRACRLNYHIECDAGWRTLSVRVEGWLGDAAVDARIQVEPAGHWRLNGAAQPEVEGCIDLDLNFSPSTNLLPIRRLGLAVGESAEITAAWLRFPSFTLEPLPQRYTRLDEQTYRYESAGGQFTADLKVDPSGFVVDYPGIWLAETLSK